MMDRATQLKILTFLERLWLVAALLGMACVVFFLLIKDNDSALFFFAFFLLSSVLYLLRKRQKKRFIESENKPVQPIEKK